MCLEIKDWMSRVVRSAKVPQDQQIKSWCRLIQLTDHGMAKAYKRALVHAVLRQAKLPSKPTHQ